MSKDAKVPMFKSSANRTPVLKTLCSNCGEDTNKGGHFVPPCFGDEGYFICKKTS